MAVAFSDATHGWVVGGNGRILATTNGGATWSAQRSATHEQFLDVAFSDASHGWAVGMVLSTEGDEYSVILATTNGGVTWSAQNTGDWGRLEAVAFTDATHAWVVA